MRDLEIALPGAFLLGLDPSAGMLQLAPRRFSRVLADARALPLQSASVDLALLIFMLFLLPDPAEGIKEARRVVRPGGLAATVTWGSALASAATRIWTDCLDEHGAAPPDPDVTARGEPLNTPEKMSALLQNAGFETIRAWSEPLVTIISLDNLLELRTRMGGEKARFDSLDETAQKTCVASARRQLKKLTDADFTATAEIVYAIAS